MTKTAKRLFVLLVAILVAAVFCLPLGRADVAYADSYGGVEFESLWYYDNLNIAEAKQIVSKWDLTKVTSPVVIACIDTGITAGHELFDGVLTRNESGVLLGYNSYAAIHGEVYDTVDLTDESSYHGTRVAGVMAMLIRELGLQNYIKIYPIKANTPTRDSFPIDSVVNALDWATGDKVRASVVNMSLSASEKGETSVWKTNETLKYGLAKASQTAVIVAAAGNNSSSSETEAFFPAAHDGVLGVMGYGKSGEMYSTSNYGDLYDVVAPERGIYTSLSGKSTYTSVTDTDKNAFNGTSAAAPIVSVAAALLKLRYIVEGKLTIENGEQKPSGVNFETMLSNLESAKVSKGEQEYCTIEFDKVLTQDFEHTDYKYQPPTEITATSDGKIGDGDYSDAYVMRANEIKTLAFLATIKPIGKTNPALEEAVEWYLREVKIGEFEDEVLSETRVGNGIRYEFTAPHGGDYEVEARLKYGERVLTTFKKVHVEYLPYLAGEVRVTTLGHEGEYVADAPSEGAIYAGDDVTFALTGIEFVDKTRPIKWFVNGEEVKNGEQTYTGTTFKFAPNEAGEYVVSAQYDDRLPISGAYTFKLTVKPTVSNPLYISLIVVGGVLVVGCAVLAIVFFVHKRKHFSKAE